MGTSWDSPEHLVPGIRDLPLQQHPAKAVELQKETGCFISPDSWAQKLGGVGGGGGEVIMLHFLIAQGLGRAGANSGSCSGQTHERERPQPPGCLRA